MQAKANNLQLDEIPHELSTLNSLELRLISLRVPFMKMVALPSGKQRIIQGLAMNVPSNLCTILPTETKLIALKLEWLKANNSLYANVNVNRQWMDECEANDNDIFHMHGLVNQLETKDNNCASDSRAGGNNSCNDCLTSDVDIPSGRLAKLARDNGFTVHDVPGDGNCLFNAVAYQLHSVSASEMREIVANHLKSNSTFYRNFLAQPVHSGNAYKLCRH